jgi:hypothetical protein
VGTTEPQQHEVGRQDVYFNRNLALLVLAFAALLTVDAASRLRGTGCASFASGVNLSLATTLTAAGLYLLWCWRFLVRHSDKPTAYFRAFDARHLWASNVALFGVGPFLTALAVITYLGHVKFVSGLLVGPPSLLMLGALSRATGGIRSL